MDILSAGGKHVYCEKPVGVDIPQTRRALQIAKRIDGKVSASVGFQIRSAPRFAEIVQRIHAGQIGKIASIAGYYNAPPATYPDRGAMPHDEQRLRNWLWDKILSGDILLEQNIHVIERVQLGDGIASFESHSTR
jgi:myo-inositol 2-dehydrogenase/D-chiro-inositol 1-dehydrogenase